MILPEAPAVPGWERLRFWQDHYPAIRAALAAETRAILPPAPCVFAALAATRPEDVRVVLIGQDPYPTPGHAHGLAFSVTAGTHPLPRSLSNIFKEMQSDLRTVPASGDLSHWAAQGVLMLNAALTVPAGAAGGHARLGWDRLLAEVLAMTASRPLAYLLWGAAAQRLACGRGHADALRIETAHPSPLSARRGFFGSRPFSRVNGWLTARGAAPIDWAGLSKPVAQG